MSIIDSQTESVIWTVLAFHFQLCLDVGACAELSQQPAGVLQVASILAKPGRVPLSSILRLLAAVPLHYLLPHAPLHKLVAGEHTSLLAL